MTRIMASHFENVVVSDFEVTRPFRGTIRSLEYLVETYKEDVALAIGADNFIYLSTWIEAEALIKNYKIIVFDRDGLITEEVVMLFEVEYGVKIDVINFSFNISASEIRSNPKKYRKNLLPEVYEYIQNNKLYLKEDKK
jgi:nicotinate-nucleotide adenylyltransferase